MNSALLLRRGGRNTEICYAVQTLAVVVNNAPAVRENAPRLIVHEIVRDEKSKFAAKQEHQSWGQPAALDRGRFCGRQRMMNLSQANQTNQLMASQMTRQKQSISVQPLKIGCPAQF
jgi:hypothetical protein